MYRYGVPAAIVAACLALSAAATGWARRESTRLYVDGKVASEGVITKDGVAYVPIRDVASALSYKMQLREDGYSLVKGVSAYKAAEVEGKAGQELSNGSFRIKVSSVTRADTYKRQLSHAEIVAPTGSDVAAVSLRLKNSTSKKQAVRVFGKSVSLVGEDDTRFPFYDGETLLNELEMAPGQTADVVLTFFVPKAARIKELEYRVDCPAHPTIPFRVSLR